jgi:hypothetical protein
MLTAMIALAHRGYAISLAEALDDYSERNHRLYDLARCLALGADAAHPDVIEFFAAVWFVDPVLERYWFDQSSGAIATQMTGLIQWALPGQADGARYTLCGRPAFSSEVVNPSGLKHVLMDPELYRLVSKVPGESPIDLPAVFPAGPDFMPSAHVYFDTGKRAMRSKLRVDDRPLWNGPRTLSDGSLTYAAVNMTPNA